MKRFYVIIGNPVVLLIHIMRSGPRQPDLLPVGVLFYLTNLIEGQEACCFSESA